MTEHQKRIVVSFSNDLVCRYCGFIAKSMQGLGSHKHHKHGIVRPKVTPAWTKEEMKIAKLATKLRDEGKI